MAARRVSSTGDGQGFFIVTEIRRCAAENGGVPLGQRRFLDETGIRETDWSGKFWARWGDALAEAGFEPNRLNPAYPEDALLRSLALFVRELGRVPVSAELKMRARRGDGFPSHNTFARWGSKQNQIIRLAAFCAHEPEFADVHEIVAPLAVATADDTTSSINSAEIRGSVYLAKSGKHYKIGRTNSTGRRLHEIRTQLPEQLTLVHEIQTDDPPGIEHYWHRRFKEKQTNGEWFLLTRSDVAAFKRRRAFM